MLRLGILGSTKGTAMLAMIHAIAEKNLPVSIEIVLSNRAAALILERARDQGIEAHFIDPEGVTREIYDKQLSSQLKAHQVDLVVLIGYMRILTPAFVEEWKNRIINVHPSLLPAFAGGMNNDVHQAVLKAGVIETGCTVHIVTDAVDAGPILIQKKCVVLPNDTVDSLKKRVQALEGAALTEAILLLGAP